MWASTSGVPKAFHWSPYLASVRSVFFSPEPPIMIGRWGWIGRGRATRSLVWYLAPSWVTVSPSSSARMMPTDSSIQSRRSPKPDPNSMPKASASKPFQAPPMPQTARPSLMWSMVMIDLATRPGLRNGLAPTINPSAMRFVSVAQAARAV